LNKEKDETLGDPFGNVWITSRTRMQSHARFVHYDLLSHIILTAYSVLLLGFSVFVEHLSGTKFGPYLSEISIVLSLSVLCASLVIWGLKLSKTADQHRECYLSLQKLYDNDRDNIDLYHQILDRHPNQSSFDYESMLYHNVWRQKKSVRDREGVISFGGKRLTMFWISRLSRMLCGFVIVFFPIIFLVGLYVVS